MKSELLDDYLSKISQRVDWLVTTCINSMALPTARESARQHLNTTLIEILKEVYEVAYIDGEKKASYNHDQRYRVGKYKLEQKLRSKLRKEVIDEVFKEYKIKDEKSKEKILNRMEKNDETEVEEDLEQQDL